VATAGDCTDSCWFAGLCADPCVFARVHGQGVPEAQYQLGQCLMHGMGGKTDQEAAMRWLRKAASQGLALAQDAVSLLERSGAFVGEL
jgi:TPR repeat protein